MRWCPSVLCVLMAVAALAAAVPVPDARPETLQETQAQLPAEVQERLSALQLDDQQLEQVTRDKRTIAVLRQLFPGLGQLIDRKIQQITQYLFRTIGRLVLRGGLGGGGGGAAAAAAGGGGAGASPNRRISITLPTFPPDSEEDEDEESATAVTTTTEEAGSEGSPAELNPEENQLAGAESEVNEVRSQYTEGNAFNTDQQAAASGGNDVPDPANLALDNEEEADRDKRQFSFGGGSSGGSGNFLFDIIRLVSGGSSGGASEASTDGTGASGGEKDEGYGDGIPGPVTRLFIIANRGIANLIQDLILRIAQTSERLVNFKARLITSII